MKQMMMFQQKIKFRNQTLCNPNLTLFELEVQSGVPHTLPQVKMEFCSH